HAGAGFYDLAGGPAAKTGEANEGILRLTARPDVPAAFQPYLDQVRAANEGRYEIARYPGSPGLMAGLARPADRTIACELHPEDAVALRQALGGRIRVVTGDGYRTLLSLVPPPEKRGLV